MIINVRTYKIVLGLLISLAVFLIPQNVNAATMYVAPSSGTHAVGDSFSVFINTNSQGTAVNAAEGTLKFDPLLLNVISISKVGSKINLYVEEPSFSNVSGQIRFTGVILNPGYDGPAGRLIRVDFRAKRTGTTNVSFISGELLANDGLGTSIFAGTSGGTYTIIDSPVVTPLPVDPDLTPTPTTAVLPTLGPVTVEQVITDDLSNPRPQVIIEIVGDLSLFESMRLIIDGIDIADLGLDVLGLPYELPPLSPGTHRVEIIALDTSQTAYSGSTDAVVLSTIKPILENVMIDPGTSTLDVDGLASPDTIVEVIIEGDNIPTPSIYYITTDVYGRFHIDSNSLPRGFYTVYAYALDDEKNRSPKSNEMQVRISFFGFLKRFLTGGIICLILLLIVILLTIKVIKQRREIKRLEKKLKRGGIPVARPAVARMIDIGIGRRL